MRHIVSTLRELSAFLWKEKMWWMVPMLIVILVFFGILFFGNSTGLGPLIYTVF